MLSLIYMPLRAGKVTMPSVIMIIRNLLYGKVRPTKPRQSTFGGGFLNDTRHEVWVAGYDLLNEPAWNLPGWDRPEKSLWKDNQMLSDQRAIIIFYLLKETGMLMIIQVLHPPGMRIWFILFISIGQMQHLRI
jgi:hypothetical protein